MQVDVERDARRKGLQTAVERTSFRDDCQRGGQLSGGGRRGGRRTQQQQHDGEAFFHGLFLRAQGWLFRREARGGSVKGAPVRLGILVSVCLALALAACTKVSTSNGPVNGGNRSTIHGVVRIAIKAEPNTLDPL